MAIKKVRMTERQRIEALLNRRKPDRVPIWPFAIPGFSAIYSGLTINDAYTNPEACYHAQRKACEDFDWVFVPIMIYASFGAWEFGGEIRLPSKEFDQAPMVIRHPIEKEEDVYHLNFPGPESGFYPTLFKFQEVARRESTGNEPFRAKISAGGSFGLACNLAGLDKFFKWLIKKPDLAHDLMRQLNQWSIKQMEMLHNTLGTDRVLGMCGGAFSSNLLISSKQFQKFVLPYEKEAISKFRELGYKSIFAHLCGEHNKNLPYWAELDFGDPGIISVGHEVDLETAAEYFPNDIIYGNLEPTLLQNGTPEEVYSATRKVVEKGKKIKGGFIFSTGCDLPPFTPIENIKIMNQAVDDYGWYE